MQSPDENQRELLRLIPRVDELADQAGSSLPDASRRLLLSAVRDVLDEARRSVLDSTGEYASAAELQLEALVERVSDRVAAITSPSFRKVINATGVVLHTNIGRAPLSPRALEAVCATAGGYSNLEYVLSSGRRGSRQQHLEPLLCALTGSEAAYVVNNNAAAVLLVLATLARGREVIVSRGQLVEIGDSFRLPDIMAQGGCFLVEVGTTNRTCPEDYSNAIGPDTALIMRIHTSNYRIVGYTEDVPLSQLVELGRAHFVPVVEDLGSGSLVDLSVIGLEGEPTAAESVAAGADLVTFSGDKLMGGPQAGIIMGSEEYIEAVRKHPLARALRPDKMTIAALEATLLDYLDPDRAFDSVPALRMLSEDEKSVRARATRLKRMLDRTGAADLAYRVEADVSKAGGGSLPTAEIPTWCLVVTHDLMTVEDLEERLRRSGPPVLGRVKDDSLRLDLRTVSDGEVAVLAAVLCSLE